MIELYCNNCGENTHLFRDCPEPITSFGVVCIHYNDDPNVKGKNNRTKYINNNLKYLMIRRRNSFTYIEFIRAKYDLLKPDYIQKLFENMTMFERESIMKNKFNYLWNNLWLIKKNQMTRQKNKSDFYKGIIKFNILKNGYINHETCKDHTLKKFINNCKQNYKHPEWFFPKGRRNQYESNINCAKREFMEETNIKYEDFSILHNHKKYTETHIGSNNINYRTILHVAKYNYEYLPDINLSHKNKHQSEEIGDIKWLSYNDVMKMFRDYEVDKVNTIKKIHKQIIKEYL